MREATGRLFLIAANLPFSGSIGRFSSQVTSGIQVLPADELFGGTVWDGQLNPYDPSLFSIQVVPEPAVSGLLLLGLLSVSMRLTRR